jgi:hypothetical protein
LKWILTRRLTSPVTRQARGYRTRHVGAWTAANSSTRSIDDYPGKMEVWSWFKQRFRFLTFSLMGLLAVASLLTPPDKSGDTTAPLLASASVDPKVLSLLERSCGDCHSERTVYPWYSYVAPVSWLVQSDVASGRRHLNLSRWNDYPLVRRQRSLSEIANQVKDGDMPLPYYTLIHPNARLSAADVDAIFQWTQAERARLIAGS